MKTNIGAAAISVAYYGDEEDVEYASVVLHFGDTILDHRLFDSNEHSLEEVEQAIEDMAERYGVPGVFTFGQPQPVEFCDCDVCDGSLVVCIADDHPYFANVEWN